MRMRETSTQGLNSCQGYSPGCLHISTLYYPLKPYSESSPYRIPTNSLHNPLPHSLLRTRQYSGTYTWRFMGSYMGGYTSPNVGYNYSYPTYNPYL